jgi:HD-like signal output (HDOD) protein
LAQRVLHDIGRLVICLKLPLKVLEVSLRIKTKGETLHKAEFETMGFNHADVGGLLMKTWELPKALEEAVGFHHNPAEATEFPLEASMIHVAEVIANTLDLGFKYEEKDIIPTMDKYASERLQVPEDSSFPNIKKQVANEFDQIVQVFLQSA